MTDPALGNGIALVGQLGPALERGDRAKVNHIIEQLVLLRAPMGGQWRQLAYIAFGYGELSLARKAMDMLVEAAGRGFAVQLQKMEFLALMEAWQDADAILRALPDTVPDPIGNAYNRGKMALNLGRPDEARRYLDQVARARPQSGFAWFSLAMTVNFAREPELAERLIAAERGMAHAPAMERIPFLYALGKVHADRGAHALAFEAFALGAAQGKATIAYDHEADRMDAAKAIDGYTTERIAAIAREQREPTARTIFVSGLPRSGTTLVQQILTSHSAVNGGGETSRLQLLANEVGGSSWSALRGYIDAHGTTPAAQLWRHWIDELYPESGRIVDKTVTTSRFLGLAAALLPEAPLVWITRDPLDRAWSCFRTNFAGSAMPWSYDLQSIAAHFRVEDQLLAQWQDILGDRLLVLSYEALVTDPETWIRRLLAHCGLAEESKVFAPHENREPVATASMMQVRRPINREGIGAAAPYRAFLEPFIEAYFD